MNTHMDDTNVVCNHNTVHGNSSKWLGMCSALLLGISLHHNVLAKCEGVAPPSGVKPQFWGQIREIGVPYSHEFLLGPVTQKNYQQSDDPIEVPLILASYKWPQTLVIDGRQDYGEAFADDHGVFWAYAKRVQWDTYWDDTIPYPDPGNARSGVNTNVHWEQTYIKTSADACFTFHISRAYLRTQALGNAKAGLLSDVFVYTKTKTIFDFVEEAQIWQTTVAPSGDVVMSPFEPTGPMTWTESVSGSIADTREIVFEPYTGYVDLSSVAVGQQFKVWFHVLTEAATGWGEYASAEAYFRDPIGGDDSISVEVSGVEAVENTSSAATPSDVAYAQVVHTDKIVTAGYAFNGSDYDFALARYNLDGSLDTATFGAGTGKVITAVGEGNDIANALLVQGFDSKIIAAGSAETSNNSDFALMRYLNDGSPDASFGSAGTGKVTLDMGSKSDAINAIILQPTDYKIIAVGHASNGTHNVMALARFDKDGNLDTGFGSAGKILTDVGVSETATSVAIQPDGKIVVAGSTDSGDATNTDFIITRYNNDGELDTTFGTAGSVVVDFSNGPDLATALQLVGDKILVAGHSYNGSNTVFALASINSDGSMDGGFGSGGKAVADFEGRHAYANALAVQGDRKLVITGYMINDTNEDFAIARFNLDGSTDTSFGTQGKVTIDFAGKNDEANALSIQPDGHILIAGSAVTDTSEDFALVRLNP